MQLQKNDRVKVVDENLEGHVLKVDHEEVIIECQDGFEYAFSIYDLIKVSKDGRAEHQTRNLKNKLKESNPPNEAIKNIHYEGDKPIVDLHLEELCPNEHFITNHDALIFQLNYCKEVIESAIRKKNRNIVFIHGVGAGKLKSAIRTMIAECYPTIECFDASYAKYGIGATEIIIHRLNQL